MGVAHHRAPHGRAPGRRGLPGLSVDHGSRGRAGRGSVRVTIRGRRRTAHFYHTTYKNKAKSKNMYRREAGDFAHILSVQAREEGCVWVRHVPVEFGRGLWCTGGGCSSP